MKTQLHPYPEQYDFADEDFYQKFLIFLSQQGFKLTDGNITKGGKSVGTYGKIRHQETAIYKAHTTYFVELTTMVP